jgi:hypothetical protein
VGSECIKTGVMQLCIPVCIIHETEVEIPLEAYKVVTLDAKEG